MFKVIFLVNDELLPQDLVQAKALEFYQAAPKVLVDVPSGIEGKKLVELTLSGAEVEILNLAGLDENFGIQQTEFAITEV